MSTPKKPTETEKLLADIEVFLEEFGMQASTFGHHTNSDSKLVARLREGRTVSLDTAGRIRDYMVQRRAAARRSGQKKAAA